VKIKVKPFMTIKKAMGDKAEVEMEMENATIRGILIQLSNRYGEKFRNSVFELQSQEIKKYNMILVNGRQYQHLPDGLDTKLSEGDKVALFPPVGGG